MKNSTILTTLMLVFSASITQAGDLSFTANTEQHAANGAVQKGKLFVSPMGTRYEYNEQGRKVVQLLPVKGGVMHVLFPGEKTYMKLAGSSSAAQFGRGPKVPCHPGPYLSCKKTGNAKISGVDTQIWQMQPKGGTMITINWNPKRRFSVRQTLPAGGVANLRNDGTTNHDSRKVEKWTIVMNTSGNDKEHGVMLYDPELKIMLSESRKGAGSRSLKNIKIGKLNAALFTVPAAFKKLDMPRGSGAIGQ